MAKQTHRHNITDGLYIFKQDNSEYWYARFKSDGKWEVKSTKKKVQIAAEHSARKLLNEREFQIKHNVVIPRTRRAKKYLFTDVANLAIQRMKEMQKEGTGKAIFAGYIQILNKYHKEYFTKTTIMDIDQVMLRRFDTWRIKKLGRNPAKSTILDHNSAFNRVFDEAIIRGYIVATQKPTLGNTGSSGKRRASFTEEEFDQLVNVAYDFADEARTKKSKMIRELLRDYIVIAANSGIRPGTEMANLVWGDISLARKKESMALYITVREGKTTSHTGIRKTVCRGDAHVAFLNLRDMFPDRKPEDPIFVLRDGTKTKQLGKSFRQLLRKANMEYSSEGKHGIF